MIEFVKTEQSSLSVPSPSAQLETTFVPNAYESEVGTPNAQESATSIGESDSAAGGVGDFASYAAGSFGTLSGAVALSKTFNEERREAFWKRRAARWNHVERKRAMHDAFNERMKDRSTWNTKQIAQSRMERKSRCVRETPFLHLQWMSAILSLIRGIEWSLYS